MRSRPWATSATPSCVSGPATVDYNFAPVLGVTEGSTGARTAAACKGACGEPPEVPVDLVMILDRTGCMNGVDTENARAAADSVRKVLRPATCSGSA